MTYFARMRTTFSVSTVGQAAALAALDDEAHTRMALKNNAEQAQRLVQDLIELGYHPVQPWGNFIYCELGDDAAAVASRMQTEGVIIRPLGPWGAPSAIRITIGMPVHNGVCLKAFKKMTERAAMR
jgi:histidinol-phosphate aminotransferase